MPTQERIFGHLEKLQGRTPWGAVLDAGTGSHSLDWIAGLDTTRWAAVTADPARARAIEKRFVGRMRPEDRVHCGNWTDHAFLHGEVFDVVLADYLVGAVDYFAPYYQDILIERLRPHVSSRLYVVGLEPYAHNGDSPGARIILQIARLRDACILLAGHRCYREFPLEWMLRHLERSGYVIEDATRFPIIYGKKFIDGQLDVCVKKLRFLDDTDLATALARRIETLREHALSFCAINRGIRFGEDYVIDARPANR